MKFRITLKDPDGFYDGVEEAARKFVAAKEPLDEDEREELVDIKKDKIWNELGKFVEYKEYITLEFDTEAGTVKVLER